VTAADWRAKADRLRRQAKSTGCFLCSAELLQQADKLEERADREEADGDAGQPV
jgi:hypothetical protein